MHRRAITVSGIVQGVGFRPYVFNLATALGLSGFVCNQSGEVYIEIQGQAGQVDVFVERLSGRPPALARITSLISREISPSGDRRFHIRPSREEGHAAPVICPDTATCDQCLAELFDPSNRRYRYAFLNCTNCGPRLTIITGSPYDRPRTTMAGFTMCGACLGEYENPRDRRFHAQPNACGVCGPQLALLDADGAPVAASDALGAFVDAIAEGKVGALKGLGGYHLVCDAANEASVAALRRRKGREEKPFAVMVRDLPHAKALCEVEEAEARLLDSARRPIVLLRAREGIGIVDAVAPGRAELGVMLPYTPVHHLLLHDVAARFGQARALVMTSGNRSDEPIAYRDEEAAEQLARIADLFLTNNRPIHLRCDDSVMRVMDGKVSPIRRSRGEAPAPLGLPRACVRPMLAVGGQLKTTFCLGRERMAVMSHHLGDLDHYSAYLAFERDIAHYQTLFELEPRVIVHDLHPDYASTRYAIERAGREGLGRLSVQHHHAHMASCMAEHHLDGQVIAVTFDGTGYGDDGAVWGGEVLVGDYRRFRRAASLRYVGLPGGDRAVYQPWRMGVSHLLDAGATVDGIAHQVGGREVRTTAKMLERGVNTVMTSSAGRLFDAVAAIIGLRHYVSYEGQAAIELEQCARRCEDAGAYPFGIERVEVDQAEAAVGGGRWIVDTRPLVRAVAEQVGAVNPNVIARRFHHTIATMISHVCQQIAHETALDRVLLSGGVFGNALLTREVSERLGDAGLRVFGHETVPANDGGLSLGQLAIGAARVAEDQGAPAGACDEAAAVTTER